MNVFRFQSTSTKGENVCEEESVCMTLLKTGNFMIK